jgi:hypothetical protein
MKGFSLSADALDRLIECRRRLQHRERMLELKRQLPNQRSPAERDQIVVGKGRISRDPVNKQAAMIVARETNWLHHPPDVRRIDEENKKTKGVSEMKGSIGESTVERGTAPGEPLQGGPKTAMGTPMTSNSGIPRDSNPEEYFNIHDVAVKVIAEINKEPHQLSTLARAAFDARKVLDENMKMIGPVMEEFNGRVKVALEDVRQSRMAIVGEIAHLLQPLKEVRAFLIGKDYEHEIKRLKEFVDLCERLEKLKTSGMLDALADTIIKLA